ncbi:fasciclin-like arabinogalactan protein 1 [Miscanthus floridulus]|uniref:fasciclin-like arabinogalactan protein 1 n=1 Tax=Miscanthus floridulus TaxID=154761 RepID=UPI0034593ACB
MELRRMMISGERWSGKRRPRQSRLLLLRPSILRRGFVLAGFDLDGDYDDDDVAFHTSSSSSSKVSGPRAPYYSAGAPRPSARARLRAMWCRITREKKRILLCSTGCVPNITALMSKGGCKAFASLVSKSPDTLFAFQLAVGGGVTAFYPTDDAVRGFKPSYRNLSADGKASLLLFHAVPVYYTLRGLKSSNGPMNTLATDGAASNYNLTVQNAGDQVTLRTSASDDPARVRSIVYDRDPVAIYAVDAVLEPVELFDPMADAPAPAPTPVAVGVGVDSGAGARGRSQ